jgi:hypothetical protein
MQPAGAGGTIASVHACAAATMARCAQLATSGEDLI